MEPHVATALAADLESSSGTRTRLGALAAEGPLFVYGIKDGCPVNRVAQAHFDALARAYAGTVRFVGISNHRPDQFGPWRDEHAPSYPVLFDPSRAVIRGLGIQSSPWLVRIEPDGKVSGSWPGFGREGLGAVSGAMALAAGRPPAKLPFEGAPEKNRYG